MKVLIISEGYYPYNGGLEKIVTEVVEGLNNTKQYQITVLTSTKKNEKKHVEKIHGIRVIYLPLNIVHGKINFILELLNIRIYMKQLLMEDYDFISIQYMGYFSVVFSSLKTKTPYSISIHGMDVTGQKKCLVKLIQKRIVKNASVVISNSHYLAKELKEKIGYSFQAKLVVIWNGIHLEKYKPDKELTLNKTIVSVGRFVYKKGFDVLVDAFSRVKKQCPDARLIIAGDGAEKLKCEKLAEKLEIRDSIDFLGLVDNEQIPSVMKQGRIFILPSRNEPFGIVILEAMALGIPVIATDSGGVTEILNGGECGCLIPTDNPDEMAECMLRLLEDNVLSAELRRKGLERIKLFSIEEVVSKYDRIIMKYAKT